MERGVLEVCHVVCEDFSSKTYAEASFCRPPVSSRIDTEPDLSSSNNSKK